jgi:hypothetical protein
LKLVLCYRGSCGDRGQKGGGRGCGGGVKGKGAGDEEQDGEEGGEVVFFSIVHRKFSDGKLGMPLRYERFVVLWEGRYPWRGLGVGRGPVVFGGEVVRGFEGAVNGTEGWRQLRSERGHAKEHEREEGLKRDGEFMKRVGFTYTTSIAWAWRPSVGAEERGEGGLDGDAESLSRLGMGYLDDELIIGVGLDDIAQVVVRVRAEELLSCLRLCPGARN